MSNFGDIAGASVQHPRAEPDNLTKDWKVEASCLGQDSAVQAVKVKQMYCRMLVVFKFISYKWLHEEKIGPNVNHQDDIHK